MRTHTRHVLMCTGPRCTDGNPQGETLFQKLGEKIDSRPHLRVKRTRSHCFVVCRQGPIVVVYPEGVWYHCVDETILERIVVEHLEGGREVSEHVFHRLSSGDVCALEHQDV